MSCVKKSLEFCSRHKRGLSFVIPIIAGLIFMLLASINLCESIWFDEAYTSFLIRGNFFDIWNATALDVHPPLFYFCLKIWSCFFGPQDFALRFMSVFFGAIAIVLVFQLIRRWFGAKAATVSCFLVSISPLIIRYGQEMRMYTLAIVLVLGATLALTTALKTRQRRHYMIYGALIGLSMWTHYFTIFVWVAQLAYLIYYYRVKYHQKIWQPNIRWAYGTAIAVFLPWMAWLFIQFFVVQIGYWAHPLTLATPLDFVSESLILLNSSSVTNWLMVMVAAVIILFIVLAYKMYKMSPKTEKYKYVLFGCVIVIPPVLLMLVSLPPLRTLYVTRYLLHSTLLIWAMSGVMIVYHLTHLHKHAKSQRRWWKLATISFGILLLGCATVGIISGETRGQQSDIKNVMSSIQATDGDAPILAASEYVYLDSMQYSSDKNTVYGVNDWYTYYYGAHKAIRQYDINIIQDLDAFTNEHKTIWYIADKNNAAVPDVLTQKGYRVTDKISYDTDSSSQHTAFRLEK